MSTMHHALLLLGLTISFRPALSACPPPATLPVCARFFEHSSARGGRDSCGGASFDMAAEAADAHLGYSDWNDRVSSLVVKSGCYVKAFEHEAYGGEGRTFRGENVHLTVIKYILNCMVLLLLTSAM